MKNDVLLPINITHPNTTLLKYAVFTAKNIGARLLLLDSHLKANPISSVGAYSPTSTLASKSKVKKAKQKLQAVCEKLYVAWEYTRAKLVVADLVAGRKKQKEYLIVEEIQKQAPSMVIMGIDSDDNWINALVGTHETRIAEQSNCPVLLIPNEVSYSEIMEINYLLDRQKPLREIVQEILFLKQLSSTLYQSATINILCKSEEGLKSDFHLQQKILESTFGESDLVFTRLPINNTEKAILENTAEYAADLFAFPNLDCNLIERLKNSITTKKLILQANIPILVF